ncbi:aBC-type transport system permease and ATPase components [Firmicutes bacterium CAG:313]|nr:aBC-type transport system permease and ATPase components [Firmicutes bacterium CAG:313]
MVFGKYVNKFYKKYFWHFFFGILTVIFVDYIQLFIPAITGRIIDSITNGGISEGNWQFLIEQIIYIALVGLGMFVGRFLWRICIFGEAVLVQSDLRFDMFEKTEKLSQRYYKVNKTGAILSYFSNDLETIEESFGFGIVQMIDGVFLLVMSLVKMFKLQGVLTLLLLIPVVLLGLCAFFVDKLMEKKYEKRQKAFEDMSDYAQENFTGIRVIKAFVKERKELKQFAKEAKKNKDTNIEYVKVSSLLEVLFNALIYVIFGIILLGGSYLVYLNIKSGGVEGITIGSLIEFIGYADTLIWPIFALAGTINLIARARTSLKRISNLLDEKVEIVDDKVVCPTDLKGEIEFKNFNFAYPDDENTLILKDVNIKIKAGETIGIVGKIGSGKSTLVNMLFRLYNVEDNTLFIDGYDIMHLPIRMVRDTIGYCPQDNFLFSDSIRNNIAFSNPDMSLEEVEKAAEFADVRSNIEEFKDKYETLIGEKGVSLSGGQKQRISIARAIVKDPKILVLDDSVSAVDVKTEETILHNIQKDRKGKTTILIASRVSTVKALDKIIVMNDGKVEAFGTHEECLKNSKTYTRMVELQSLEKEMEGE